MKKTMIRLLSTALAFTFSINVIAMTSANTAAEEITAEPETIAERLENGFANFQTSIDIMEYDYSMDEFQNLNDIINEVILDPELFYLNLASIKCGGAYDENGQVVLSEVKVEYGNTAEEVKPLVDKFNQTTEEIINKTVNDSMTDMEKALKLHDYLVLNSSYDLDNKMPDLNNGISAYDIMVMNNGVCQGYAQAYRYLLDKVGVNSIMVTSNDMVHAWNMVEIDNQWYHVDVTWDDPVPDNKGKVYHSYFMLSDSAVSTKTKTRTNKHYNWDNSEIKATDTQYDNAFWSDVNSEIYVAEGKWYFINSEGEYCTYVTADKSVNSNVRIDDERWHVWESETKYWSGKYASLIISGNTVYYNTPVMIYSMNLDGSWKMPVKYVNPYDTKGYVYGMVLKNDILYAVIKQAPSDEGTLYEVTTLHLDNYSYFDTVLKSIADLKDGESSTFNMTGLSETILPAEAIELIKGRNVELVFDFEGYEWAINGQNVKSTASKNLNLQISENQGKIPAELLSATSNGQKAIEINLAHEGEFGLSANVNFYVGKEFAGQTATVFYYNQVAAKMDKISETTVDAEGNAAISLEHASSYAVVVNEKAAVTTTNTTPATTTVTTTNTTPATTTATTTNTTPATTTVTTTNTTSATTTVTVPETKRTYGDANEDGSVDLSDLTKVSLFLLGDVSLTAEGQLNADVNHNGKVDLADLAMLKQYISLDITSLN